MLLCDEPHTVSKHAKHVTCVAGALVSPSVAKIAGSSKGFQQNGTRPRAAPPAAVMMLLCRRRLESVLNKTLGEQLLPGAGDPRPESGWSRGRFAGNSGDFYRQTDEYISVRLTSLGEKYPGLITKLR